MSGAQKVVARCGMGATRTHQPYMGLFLEDLAFANANYDTGLGTLSEPGQRCGLCREGHHERSRCRGALTR